MASLFRNFLLAERIMAAANCTPISYPRSDESWQTAPPSAIPGQMSHGKLHPHQLSQVR